MTRWQRIALEAAKQSGSGACAWIAGPSSSASSSKIRAIELSGTNVALLMFSEREGQSCPKLQSSHPPERES